VSIAEVTMFKTETISVNMGPQHPSTHGVFRMILELDGETIRDLKPMFGYLHRGLEKFGEERTYVQAIPATDRLDYVCCLTNEHAYMVALEKLAEIQAPPRAEYIRVIMDELTRWMAYAMAIGFLFNDLGAFYTPVQYAFRDRERVMDLFEMASGSRMMTNYLRPGGVAGDLPDGFMAQLHALIDHMERYDDELVPFLSGNEIFRARTIGVGMLPKHRAISDGVTGPVLRASGVPYDVRKAEPYSVYPELQFDVPTQVEGDVYARYVQRAAEMRECVKILRQAEKQIPGGEVMAKVPARLRPPKGEAYGRIESPKGELGFYLVSDGSVNPYRWHNRSPSLVNLTSLREMCLGHKVADTVTILGSIDITLADVDR
jgi:NADH:ubiquinone oxidoreductase subunit D